MYIRTYVHMLERVKSKDLLAASYLFISCTFPEGKAPSVALYCVVMLCNAVYSRLTSYTQQSSARHIWTSLHVNGRHVSDV